MSAGYDAQGAENDFRQYVAQYRQHLEDIRVHLAGGRSLGDHEEVDAIDHVDEPEVPAGTGEQDNVAAPAADAAPDLYFPLDVAGEPAEDEHTWTATERDALFHGLAIYSRLRPDLIASCIPTKTVPDVCAYLEALEEAASYHSLPDALDQRRIAPLAMGMSESWLEWEETQATRLAVAEPDWEAYVLNAQRQDTLATYPSDTPSAARESLLAHWKAEDALRTLDTHKLRAISHILRVDEAAEDDPSRPTTHNSITSNPTTSNPTAPNPLDEDDAETSARGRSQSPSRPRSQSSTPSTRDLSPKSRRRLQKRLYMRRKRAEKAGTEAVQDAGLLKVGRPKKARPPRKRRRRGRAVAGEEQGQAGEDQDQDGREDGDADADGGEGDDGEEGGEKGKEDEDYAHPHRGGTTAPYKARRLFEESGITPAVLAEHKLDLFDGIGVARWLEATRDDPDLEYDATSPNAISGPLLATLRNILVDFVTDVAQRAIMSREQEVHFKAVSKAWRVKSPGLVLAKNVEHALEMMGMAVPERPKKRKRPPDEADEDEEAEDVEDEDASEAEEEEDRSSSQHASRPSSRKADASSSQLVSEPDSPYDLVDDLYPTFFRLPRAYQSDPADLLPEDTDEEALERELDEEEELDAEDLVAEGEYEDGLWASLTGDPS
ncbi:hypothetical protein K523DRAFT_420859 [Schizophyllum commune Tattone D]|nr:hypothetical protein K523DRAFT_420859 [Schizophyllum commune Tattone D]